MSQLTRGWNTKCPHCGLFYWQPYEEPDGCPRCDGCEDDDEDTDEELTDGRGV